MQREGERRWEGERAKERKRNKEEGKAEERFMTSWKKSIYPGKISIKSSFLPMCVTDMSIKHNCLDII